MVLDAVKDALRAGIADLDEDGVIAMVQRCLRDGGDPTEVIAACEQGMHLVGERYEQGEYYLSGLIMAGEIFREVLEITRPALESSLAGNGAGRVLLGTVQGDIHDIGKSILEIALRAYGFTVKDLGVDVRPQAFLSEVVAWKPDIVGLSGLLTSAYDAMHETVELLKTKTHPKSGPIPIIIGGGMLSEQVRIYVGADYWCNDAIKGVRLCQQLMDARRAGS